MKVIISESQYKILKESKNRKAIIATIEEMGLVGASEILAIPVHKLIEMGVVEDQDLINHVIDYLKTECEEMNANSEEIISFDACDFLGALVSVQVTNINQTDKSFIVQIIIKYESIFAAMDEEAFIRELHYKLKKYIPNIKLQVEDSINIKDRQW
jgi:hypothetical protein